MYVLSDGVFYKPDYSGTNDVNQAAKFERISDILDFIGRKGLCPIGWQIYEIEQVQQYKVKRAM